MRFNRNLHATPNTTEWRAGWFSAGLVGLEACFASWTVDSDANQASETIKQ